MEVQCRVSVRGAHCPSSSLFKPLQRRYTVYFTNRDINPGYVGSVHFCKAPLWGRRLDLVSLNLTTGSLKTRAILLSPVAVLFTGKGPLKPFRAPFFCASLYGAYQKAFPQMGALRAVRLGPGKGKVECMIIFFDGQTF